LTDDDDYSVNPRALLTCAHIETKKFNTTKCIFNMFAEPIFKKLL